MLYPFLGVRWFKFRCSVVIYCACLELNVIGLRLICVIMYTDIYHYNTNAALGIGHTFTQNMTGRRSLNKLGCTK